MALTLIYLALGVLLLAAVQLVVFILAFLASPFGTGAALFVGSAAEIFALGVLVYVAIRMSLAAVITFDRGRLAIFDSWTATRGQFWTLFGAYVLALCCVFVVALLALVVFFTLSTIVMMAMGGGAADLGKIVQPTEVTLGTYLNPFMIAYVLLGSLFTAIYYAVIAAPGAFAYRELGRPDDRAPA
jgi:hypothetical protein